VPFSAGERSLATFRAVSNDLRKQEGDPLKFFQGGGNIALTKVDSCLKRVPESECKSFFASRVDELKAKGLDTSKCVDVTVQGFHVRADVANIGSNLLSTPRSNVPTSFKAVPAPILAFSPRFGLSRDTRYGLSPNMKLRTDLLDLSRTVKRQMPSDIEAGIRGTPSRKVHLNLDINGETSVKEPFYAAHGRLTFERRNIGNTLQTFGLETSMDAVQDPLANGKVFSNTVRLIPTLTFRPRIGFFDSMTVGAGYRRSRNRFFAGESGFDELLTENSFEGRILIDGRLAQGFTRFSIWTEHSNLQHSDASYRRTVALFGYGKEIPIALNRTIGIETIAGVGTATSGTPEYARFYGGSSLHNYLFEESQSNLLHAMPQGPLVRSAGKNESLLRQDGFVGGATSFWNLNVTASIPIPRLSAPLVPDINIADDLEDDEDEAPAVPARARKDICGNVVERRTPTLKNAIKSAGNSAGSFLVNFYKSEEQMSETEARKRACADMKEINPALDFIADQANIYSVKPLIMFDVARVKTNGVLESRTKTGLGAGLQFTVVVAKFELGYVRSLQHVASESRGNFIARLVFQNLF
jgi:hypothetical protein